MSIDLSLVAACEERIINAWPSVETMVIDGFIVRFANGYSGRANSASALSMGARFSPGTLDLIEGLYRQAGLQPCIRHTPLCHDSVRPEIAARGYVVRDGSIGMVAPLEGQVPIADGLVMTEKPTANWIRAVSARQTGSKKDADDALYAIVSRIKLPAAFATLHAEGQEVGFGMCVAERGMAEIGAIVIDASLRGRGFGRALVGGLMHWAKAHGASQAYLQVDKTNAPALKTYAWLGFQEAYRYDTMVLG